MTCKLLLALAMSAIVLVGCGDSSSGDDWIVGSWESEGPVGGVYNFSSEGTVELSKDAGKNWKPLPYTLKGGTLTWNEHKSGTKTREYKLKIESHSADSFSGMMIGFPLAMEFKRVAGS